MPGTRRRRGLLSQPAPAGCFATDGGASDGDGDGLPETGPDDAAGEGALREVIDPYSSGVDLHQLRVEINLLAGRDVRDPVVEQLALDRWDTCVGLKNLVGECRRIGGIAGLRTGSGRGPEGL